ncbi:hypothetical protein GC093_17220 [Paenibacillus sp. LMG 31456]|uniref:Uncharacterized protein n=1 Tax=Paenibacillus foliorum TaxID=2654974 RepID=A0A972GUW6_9BACL|nr:hypothetical protein [Paenibacillus foliorum]NOU94949.1 hypothetical protein [Paenibacillus foliorum]
MTIRHSIACDSSDVLVRETGPQSYEVSIQAQVNPLGKGNVIEAFSRLEEAIVAAEHFCKLYSTAKEQGYHLEGVYFVKVDKPKHHVGQLLQERKSPDALALIL